MTEEVRDFEQDYSVLSGRRRTVACIARRWNEAGLEYGTVHGAEDFPASLGRDLDVLVARRELRRAEGIACSVMKENGWTVITHRTPWGDVWLRGIQALPDRRFKVLEVDLLTRLRWAWVPLAEGPLPESRSLMRGQVRIDPWAGFVKRVLLLVLSGQIDRFSDDPGRLAIASDERPEIYRGLVEVFGEPAGERLLAAVDRRDMDWLRDEVSSLRQKALRRVFRRNPMQVARGTVAWLINEGALHLLPTPAVPVIAVVGPDGVGKSSALVGLADLLQSELRLPGVVIRHWRPEVLPPLSRLAGAAESVDVGGPPRRTAGRFRRLRLAYYALDHTLGYLTRDRILASRSFAVCYDRCLLDMAVDPLRYGLASGRGVSSLWRFLPRPDLLVLLTDIPASVHDRKSELPEHEIASQFDSWTALAERGDVDVRLSVGKDSDETARELLELYVKALIKQGSRAT